MPNLKRGGVFMYKKVLLFLGIVVLTIAVVAAPIKVILWYSQTGIYSKTLLDIVKEFNEIHKGEIEVEAVYTGSYTNTMQKLLAAMVSGDLPTIAQIEQSRVGQFIEGGVIQSLEGFIAKDPEFKKQLKDFFPRLLAACKYYGKLYGFPLNVSTPILYYNKDLFRKAGLDPNKPPKTWSELYEYAKKIAALGDDIYGYRVDAVDWLIEAYIWQFGGEIISEDGRKMLIDNPGTLEAWKFFQKMVKEKIAVFSGGKAGNALDLSGKIGMVVRSTGSLGYLRKNVKWDLGATLMPYEKKAVVPIGGGNLYIFATRPEKEKKAAWEFLKFVVKPENTLKWALSTGYMASRISAYNSPELQKLIKEDPRVGITYIQLEKRARRRPWFGPYREILAEITSGWQKVLTDPTVDPESVIKEVQKKTQQILDDYY